MNRKRRHGHFDDQKEQALPDQAREAALEQAAATLASIHMAKQVNAEIMPRPGAAGSPSLLTQNLRLPVGDVLFGVAQLQVDFARRLFEFNRSTSALLRDRLRQGRSPVAERQTITVKAFQPLQFTIKNTATLSRTFTFRAEISGIRATFSPASVTVPAGERSCAVSASFKGLPIGTYAGDIVVESNGLRMELLPFEIQP